MTTEHIEKLKREYTDKYVQVDWSRPELARFKNVVGQVKTVNMSGRALVEFTDYHLNIGWYDIAVDYLKVVDKPEPKAPETKSKPAAKKPAAQKAPAAEGEKKLSPLEMARMQGAAKKKEADPPAQEKKSAGKMSTADILAAARGGKPSGDATESAPAEQETPTAEETAETESVAEEEVVEPEVAEETSTEQPAAEEQPASADFDKSSMSIDDMLAYCRQHDTN